MAYLDDEVLEKLLGISYWTKHNSPTNFKDTFYRTIFKDMTIEVYHDGSVYFGDLIVGTARPVYDHAKGSADSLLEIKKQERIDYFLGKEE